MHRHNYKHTTSHGGTGWFHGHELKILVCDSCWSLKFVPDGKWAFRCRVRWLWWRMTHSTE